MRVKKTQMPGQSAGFNVGTVELNQWHELHDLLF